MTILEGGSITNTGTWKLTDNSDMWGSGGGAGEHFVNSGTLDKASGTGTTFIGTNNVRVDNTGTVRASVGTLDLLAGTWPGTVIDSAAGGIVDIQFDATSVLSGEYDLIGDGSTTWRGTVVPTAPVTLAFEPGEFESRINDWNSTATNTVTNTGSMPTVDSTDLGSGFVNTGSMTISGFVQTTGFTNSGTVDQGAVQVRIGDAGSVVNTGTWRMTESSSITGWSGGVLERFVNSGTVHKATGPGDAFMTGDLRVDNTGTVHVTTGTLQLSAGAWPSTVTETGTGAVLDITFGNSAVSGEYDLIGEGSTIWRGTVVPTAPVTLAFEPGEFESRINDWNSTATNTVTNTGSMPTVDSTDLGSGFVNTGSMTISGFVQTTGFTNSGTVDQGAVQVRIGEAGSVVNTGTWRMTESSSITGWSGGVLERFVNSGTVHKATGTGDAFMTGDVRVDNTGTVRVTTGTLHVDTTLSSGTWDLVNGRLGLPSTTTNNGATLVLTGPTAAVTGSTTLLSNSGDLTLNDGAVLLVGTWSTPFTNSGTVRASARRARSRRRATSSTPLRVVSSSTSRAALIRVLRHDRGRRRRRPGGHAPSHPSDAVHADSCRCLPDHALRQPDRSLRERDRHRRAAEHHVLDPAAAPQRHRRTTGR